MWSNPPQLITLSHYHKTIICLFVAFYYSSLSLECKFYSKSPHLSTSPLHPRSRRVVAHRRCQGLWGATSFSTRISGKKEIEREKERENKSGRWRSKHYLHSRLCVRESANSPSLTQATPDWVWPAANEYTPRGSVRFLAYSEKTRS